MLLGPLPLFAFLLNLLYSPHVFLLVVLGLFPCTPRGDTAFSPQTLPANVGSWITTPELTAPSPKWKQQVLPPPADHTICAFPPTLGGLTLFWKTSAGSPPVLAQRLWQPPCRHQLGAMLGYKANRRQAALSFTSLLDLSTAVLTLCWQTPTKREPIELQQEAERPLLPLLQKVPSAGADARRWLGLVGTSQSTG